MSTELKESATHPAASQPAAPHPAVPVQMDMAAWISNHFESSAATLARTGLLYSDLILRAAERVAASIQRGGKLLTCGNGGSASDSEHIAAEFIGRFRRERPSFPAISLTSCTAALTAIGNDYGYENLFARQVEGHGRPGDVLFAITTSGKSPNVLAAVAAARKLGIYTIGFTSERGAALQDAAHITFAVPSKITAEIQQAHIAIGHAICEAVDEMLCSASEPNRLANQKLVSLDDLAQMRRSWREQGKTVVWTNGCFDLLHAGHIRNLKEASSLGDILIVGLNDDASVRAIKGSARPLQTAEDRAEILGALEAVDYVTVFSESDPIHALSVIQPDIHCKGADYAAGKPLPERELIESYGGRVHFMTFHPGRSTTDLVSRAGGSTTATGL